MSNNMHLIDPSFMEGLMTFVGGKPLDNQYNLGSFERVLYNMGFGWAKDNDVTQNNILAKMMAVKDWENL